MKRGAIIKVEGAGLSVQRIPVILSMQYFSRYFRLVSTKWCLIKHCVGAYQQNKSALIKYLNSSPFLCVLHGVHLSSAPLQGADKLADISCKMILQGDFLP